MMVENSQWKAAHLSTKWPGTPIFKRMEHLRHGTAETWTGDMIDVPRVNLAAAAVAEQRQQQQWH